MIATEYLNTRTTVLTMYCCIIWLVTKQIFRNLVPYKSTTTMQKGSADED